MRQEAPTGGSLTVLRALGDAGWRAPAWALNRLGMLSERGRISDLRHRWDVPVRARSQRVHGRIHTVYEVPRGSRAHARALIRAGLRLRDDRQARREADH